MNKLVIYFIVILLNCIALLSNDQTKKNHWKDNKQKASLCFAYMWATVTQNPTLFYSHTSIFNMQFPCDTQAQNSSSGLYKAKQAHFLDTFVRQIDNVGGGDGAVTVTVSKSVKKLNSK